MRQWLPGTLPSVRNDWNPEYGDKAMFFESLACNQCVHQPSRDAASDGMLIFHNLKFRCAVSIDTSGSTPYIDSMQFCLTAQQMARSRRRRCSW
ncbi:hypothetical protein TNCT_450451 [Trichonephila clavata]|uniref:Uncharacterized protein n=1 Tax=Trichonephila clavata TaxID=2740835 RepID=A0A8X6GPG9_TRICU|nr:hypothetical protein TNCT_450451 [Trichonephila clavata]